MNLSAKEGKIRRQLVRLGGLDRTRSGAEGALTDSRGLWLEDFPCLGQRRGRQTLSQSGTCQDLFAWEKLCTVQDGALWYDGKALMAVTPGKKQFAVVGSKLCVFPDKKYLDLRTRETGSLAARAATVPASVRFTENTLELRGLHSVLGRYNFRKEALSKPDYTQWFRFMVYRLEDMVWDPVNGWSLPAGVEKKVAELEVGDCMMLPRSDWRGDRDPVYRTGSNQFPTEYDAWGDFVCVYAEIDYVGGTYSWFKIPLERRNAAAANPSLMAQGFRVGDTVTVSGCVTLPENDRTARLTQITSNALFFDAGTFTPGEEAGAVTVERWVPELDFVCESDNRLFGVNNAQRTIYASAWGDPASFCVRDGLATDSWQTSVGTDGDFTGCAAYAGSVLFWKEDCLHRLVGSSPASYQLYVSQVPGLQRGCEGSLVTLNETLYYKSRDGVFAYAGSTPKLVSQALGGVSYDSAAAGGDSRGYHISMRRRDTGTWELLTYDPEKKLWVKEDDLACARFACLDGQLYALSEGKVLALDRGGDDDGAPIGWEAAFTPFTETVHARKYPSRLLLRLELEPGAWVEAELARDGGPFQTVWSCHDSNALTAVIPIRPGRCDRYQVRLRGEGRCLIHSMAREFSLGGVR